MNIASPIRDAVRAAFASRFGPKRDARLIHPGETLADATARRWGIPAAKRPAVAPNSVRHLVPNRADRRATSTREARLASYSRQLTGKAAQ